MIPTTYIDALVEAADIVDVISSEIELKKAGQNQVGICPFHKSSQVQFTVSPEKRFYHCFGCGAHGSVIGFLMEYHGLKFVEAIELLAKKVGFAPPDTGYRRPAAKLKLADTEPLIDAAFKFYKSRLKTVPEAIRFMKNRGITGPTAAKFGIGFAPDGWQNLEPVLGNAYRTESAIKAGLAIRNDSGRTYDRFRNRLLFPLFQANGSPAGFVGRSIDGAEPTILRQPQDDDVPARSRIFGNSVAKKAMQAERSVIVVPGCMDVLAMHERGFYNVVSIPALGRTCVQIIGALFRQVRLILICFDNTDAGNRTSWSVMEASLPAITDKHNIRFVALPEGQSPSSTLDLEDGVATLRLLLQGAMPLPDFLLEGLVSDFDARSIEGRAALMSRATEIVDKIKAPYIQQFIRERLDALCSEDLELLTTTEEHDEFLSRTIDEAESELAVVSPWITKQGLERSGICKQIYAATKRGVEVTIYTDAQLNKARKENSRTGDLFDDGSHAALVASGAKIVFVRRIHSKLVVADRSVLCVGSFNWLSAAGSGRFKRQEISTVHRTGAIDKQKTAILGNLEERAVEYG